MRRITEAALLAGSAAVAGLGVALVDFGQAGQIGWTPVVVLVVYGCGLAGLWLAVRRWAPHASPLLLPPTALIVALGLVEIYRIDPGEGSLHLWWVVAGMVGGIGVLAVFRWGVGRIMSVGYLLAISGLTVVMAPWLAPLLGVVSEEGTGLWLSVGRGPVKSLIQPFGLGLLLLAIGLAAIHSRWVLSGPLTPGKGTWIVSGRHIVLVSVVWVTTLPLLWVTGDLTAWTTVMVLSACIAYLATGARRVVWVTVALLGVGVVGGMTSPRIGETIAVWLDPFSDGQAAAGLRESLLAMGSGHLSGSGPGMGDPGLIPYASSDWILAAMGEELGLAGTVALIALYALVVAVGMGVALGSRDLFCKVTAASLSALLGLMFLAVAGGLLRLLPPTRMGLPLLAFGGLPLLEGWLVTALLLRISDEERGPL